MKRMLINATHSEEVRVALADGQKLYNLDIDVPGQERKKGNIYKGKITRVEPSLEAAFVDYGANRHGFLPYKEISRSYYTPAANKAKERPPINVAIKEGTEVIIQVNKEERGNKGAAISTYISLAGRYLVYMPENPKAGGISRRIEGKARSELKATMSQVTMPKDAGVIVRTAGIGRSSEEIEWDLNYLDQVWTAIKSMSATRKAPFFIYQESNIVIRALRDYLRKDVGEILIDNKELYEKARDFMQQVMPHNLKKLSYYNDTIPLFSRYQIESQIQSAFSREVTLPSGGSLVIDHTEAMISIDINSARATKGADIEETALNTNLEAADEIARQMRIRDLGGLLVIDFIDMRNHKNQRSVEQQLDEAVSNDRARIQTSKISKFGLLEMSRQRLKSSINESSQFVCPRCSGHGFIRNIESLSVSILRIMEEEALKPDTGKVIVQVPTKIANFIINDKREELNSLESRHAVPLYIIANEHYQSPQFEVTRLKKSEIKNFDINDVKLNKPENEEIAENKSSQGKHKHIPKAAVDALVPDSQVPVRETKTVVESSGVLGWMKSLFSSNSQTTQTTNTKAKKKQTTQKNKTQQNQRKKPQHNNKQNSNKPQNKKAQVKNTVQKNKAKPANKQQPNKAQKPKAAVNKQAKKHVHKHQPNKQVSNNTEKNIVKNDAIKVEKTATEQTKNSEQLIKRPLGSVASYAAKKAKQEGKQDVVSKTPVKTEQVKMEKVVESQKPLIPQQPKVAKAVETKPIKDSTKPQAKELKPEKSTQAEKPVQAQKQNKTQAQDKVVETKTQAKETTKAVVKEKPVAKTEKTKAVEKPKVEKPKVEKTKVEQPKVEQVKVAESKPKIEKTTAPVKKETAKKTEISKPTTAKKEVKKEVKKAVEKKPKVDTKNVSETPKQVKVSKTTKAKETKKSPEVKKPATAKKKPQNPQSEIDFDI